MGNVQPNAGPDSLMLYYTPEDFKSKSGLVVIRLNVQSLILKLDNLALNLEVSKHNYVMVAGCYRPPSAN